MDAMQEATAEFVLLWAVTDPIGTIPVFIAATAERTQTERRRIALITSLTAAAILLFFIADGEPVLLAMVSRCLPFKSPAASYCSCLHSP